MLKQKIIPQAYQMTFRIQVLIITREFFFYYELHQMRINATDLYIIII